MTLQVVVPSLLLFILSLFSGIRAPLSGHFRCRSLGLLLVFRAPLSPVDESLRLTVFVTATTLIYQRVSTSHDTSKVDESSTLFSHEGSGQPFSSNEQGDFSGSGSAIFLEELEREWELNQKRSNARLLTNVSSEDENRERLPSSFFDSERKPPTSKEPENLALLSWVTWSPEWDAGSGQGGSGSLQSDDLPIQIIIPELRQSEDQNTGNTHTWANIW